MSLVNDCKMLISILDIRYDFFNTRRFEDWIVSPSVRSGDRNYIAISIDVDWNHLAQDSVRR
jgi:hypothetical protein